MDFCSGYLIMTCCSKYKYNHQSQKLLKSCIQIHKCINQSKKDLVIVFYSCTLLLFLWTNIWGNEVVCIKQRYDCNTTISYVISNVCISQKEKIQCKCLFKYDLFNCDFVNQLLTSLSSITLSWNIQL